MIRVLSALAALAFVAACDDVVVATAPTGTGPAPVVRDVPDELRTNQQSIRAFASAVQRVEPVAERECRSRTRGVDCDFKILVDDRPGAPSNAFQTLDDNGRPLIVFTQALINDARNEDELAFVLAHEAAHHVRGHIARQRENAAAGAVIFGGLATLTGADPEAAQRIGAQVGARTYSKDFELEADQLGTILTARAGYDPIKGSQFFNRIPDPGDRFLGTHPPNAQRLETVRRTAAGL
ncbi:M48 family metallopeptidase [uncultured Tateyamaria sp.]|uniref:M48 family metallopeptidase n=1 Tax=uncultured Tateyamaria sp. TaxID=455651 RepID=UPI00260510D8|nr:M48 family metallopeptidase [uncultured Tateyamaria sp.]